MTETQIHTEHIGDIPLLMHMQSKMGIGVEINEVLTPHGNRAGMSMGAIIMVWLSYIISQCDHRMSEVQEWAKGQIGMLRALLGQEVYEKDFADDRLADILRALSDDEDWEKIEKALGTRLVISFWSYSIASEAALR